MIDYSVVMPAYNSTRTIRMALESCVRQSYPPKEIIVVDDGSTDDTVQVVHDFARLSARDTIEVKLVALEANLGPACARNVGIDHARGSWVAFLDSDDRWDPRKLEAIAAVIERNPAAALVAHRYRYSDAGNLPDAGPVIPASCARPVRFSRLLLGNYMQTSCVALRKSVGVRFDLHMKYSEDYALWLTITAKNRVLFLDRELTTLSRRQLSPGGLSGRRIKMRLGEMRSYLVVARIRTEVLFLLPLLIAYSVLRHLYSTIRYITGPTPT